jgi:hypothetical protein
LEGDIMAIVINGTGTVTGISVGGLPDMPVTVPVPLITIAIISPSN